MASARRRRSTPARPWWRTRSDRHTDAHDCRYDRRRHLLLPYPDDGRSRRHGRRAGPDRHRSTRTPDRHDRRPARGGRQRRHGHGHRRTRHGRGRGLGRRLEHAPRRRGRRVLLRRASSGRPGTRPPWRTAPTQVCNVVIDKAGHVATSSTTVTVANAAPPRLPARCRSIPRRRRARRVHASGDPEPRQGSDRAARADEAHVTLPRSKAEHGHARRHGCAGSSPPRPTSPTSSSCSISSGLRGARPTAPRSTAGSARRRRSGSGRRHRLRRAVRLRPERQHLLAGAQASSRWRR